MRYQPNRLERYRSDCPSSNPQRSKAMTKSTSATMKPRKTGSRNSLTNTPCLFPQPSQKPQPKIPAKSGPPPNPIDTVSVKKPLVENKASGNILVYPGSPPKCPAAKKRHSPLKPLKTRPSHPMTIVLPNGRASSKIPTGPVATPTAKLNARSLAGQGAEKGKKGKGTLPVELSPNKQAITKQFVTEIENAFNEIPSPEQNAKLNVSRRDMVPHDALPQPTCRSVRPLPLIPTRRSPVPIALRSPQLMGLRSPDLSTQALGTWSDPALVSQSMASPERYQDMFKDMFADAPDDDSSVSSYDLTKPLRIRPSKQRLAEKKNELPVLPFRSGRPLPPGSAGTIPLIIQKESSTLRTPSYVTPWPADPLLAVPILDKRNISAPVLRKPPLTSPVLVNKNFKTQRSPLVRGRTGFRLREGNLKESDMSNNNLWGDIDTGLHPLQARMNSMKDPAPIKRKWSSRLRPGQTESNFPSPWAV